jgi:hypothetical protein
MKKIKVKKTKYNKKSLKNLIQNNKDLTDEQKDSIKKESSKMRSKSYKWKVVLNLPSSNPDWCFTESMLCKLNGYGFDYYIIKHDKDSYIDEYGEIQTKTIHYHLVLKDSKFKLKTTTKSMLDFLSKLFGLEKNLITIEISYRFESDIAYLVHALDSDKYQYDYHSIITNRNANCTYIILKCKFADNVNRIDDMDFSDLNYYIYECNCTFRDISELVTKSYLKEYAYIINSLIACRDSEMYKALAHHNKQKEKYKNFEQYYLEIMSKGARTIKV